MISWVQTFPALLDFFLDAMLNSAHSVKWNEGYMLSMKFLTLDSVVWQNQLDSKSTSQGWDNISVYEYITSSWDMLLIFWNQIPIFVLKHAGTINKFPCQVDLPESRLHDIYTNFSAFSLPFHLFTAILHWNDGTLGPGQTAVIVCMLKRC